MKPVPLATLVENSSCAYGDDPQPGEQTFGVVKVSNVDSEGRFHRDFEQRTFPQGSLSRLLAKEGDLLVVKSSGSKTNVLSGKTALCTEDQDGQLVASNFLLRLRPKSDRAHPKYLWHYLNSRYSKDFVLKVVGATTYPNLKWDTYSAQPIPLPHKNGKPDLDEQKRIAAILDKADAIRRKRQQAISLTDDFLRSVFLDMFGDPQARGWSMTTVEGVALGEKGSIRTGPFGSQLLHSEFVDHGIAVLGIDNAVTNQFAWAKPRFITEEKYEELKRYTVHPGDVLITIMGTCGRCAVVPDDIPTAINTKHLCCITLDQEKCLPEFLHAYFLMHPVARRYLALHSKGAIMDGLNMGIIKGLPVPEAPLPLQRDFARIVKQRCGVASRLTSQQGEADDLFATLQQRAFRGEL